MPRETASSQEHQQHSSGEKSSSHDHSINCSCPFCAMTRTNYTSAVNASASGEFNGPVAAGCLFADKPALLIFQRQSGVGSVVH